MSATDPELSIQPQLADQASADMAQRILGFAADQHEARIVAKEQLLAIATIVGPYALMRTLIEEDQAGRASLSFEGLSISEVQLRKDVGSTALESETPALDAEPISDVASDAEVIQRDDAPESDDAIAASNDSKNDEPIDPEPKADPAAEADETEVTPEPEVELRGIPTRIAMQRYVHAQPGQTLDKGDFRSSGARLSGKLVEHGHSKGMVSNHLTDLAKEGIFKLDKVTPGSKIINSITLVEPEPGVVPKPVAKPLPFRDERKATEAIVDPTDKADTAEPATFDENAFEALLIAYPGRATKNYLIGLKNAGGNISIAAEDDKLLTILLDEANKSVPEGDAKLSEGEIVKVQRKLIDADIIAPLNSIATRPTLVTGVTFTDSIHAKIVKKN